MSLSQPTNIIPSSFAGIGGGTVAADSPVVISWQFSGSSPMYSYDILIYKNNDKSEYVSSCSSKNDLQVYGTDEKGNPIPYVVQQPINSTLGYTWREVFKLENGNSYKMEILLHWSTGGGVYRAANPTAVAFITRALPTLTLNSKPTTISKINAKFQATYSQAQGDAINWVRWKLTTTQDGNEKVVDDTGPIYTGVLEYEYRGFITGRRYTITCTVETENGVQVSDEHSFDVQYNELSDERVFSAICNPNEGSVLLKWSTFGEQPSIALYRKSNDNLTPLNISKYVPQVKDFGARNGVKYTYEMFWFTEGSHSVQFISQPICIRDRFYSLIEATPDPEQENVYHVLQVFRFGNNVQNPSVSNNNSPSWLTNFTPYRLRQPTSQTGKSGTLSALLGNCKDGRYKDTPDMMEKLYAISTSPNAFFLKDLKGNLYMVHTSGAITQTINAQSIDQPVTISVPWEEIGDASHVALIQTPNDPGWSGNDVGEVSLYATLDNGKLNADYPDEYNGTYFKMAGNKLNTVTPDGVTGGENIYRTSNKIIAYS